MKLGKEIPSLLLERTVEWRANIIAHQEKVTNYLLGKPELIITSHSCLICGCEIDFWGYSLMVKYFECRKCGNLQTELIPSSEALNWIYGPQDQSAYAQNNVYVDLNDSSLLKRIREISEPKIDFIHAKVDGSPGDLWIDLGSGTGDMLMLAQEKGYEALGIEVSESEIIVADKRKLKTHKEFISSDTQIPRLNQAKVLTLFNILEHIPDPIAFVVNLSKQMKTGAYIAIEVPRHNSLSSLLQRTGAYKAYRHIYPPEHLNIFSDTSMSALLKVASLNRIDTWQFGSDALELVSYAHSVNSGAENLTLMEVNILQNFLDRLLLSDVMLVIARKL